MHSHYYTAWERERAESRRSDNFQTLGQNAAAVCTDDDDDDAMNAVEEEEEEAVAYRQTTGSRTSSSHLNLNI